MEGLKIYKGIIFDIDGTLVMHGSALPGVIDSLKKIRKMGYKLRFVSNTTGRNEEQLADQLRSLGLEVYKHEIMTSVSACVSYLQSEYASGKGFFAVPELLKSRFSSLPQVDENPDYVVLGDLDEDFNYLLLNKIFNFLRCGSKLIVFHKNPWYFRHEKTWLDSGSFTQALEFASGIKAVVTGKPSPVMFRCAIQSMGLDERQVLVVGDDVTTDVAGARNAKLDYLLIGSGKFKRDDIVTHQVPSTNFVSTFSELSTWLESKVII
ncbi:HAD-IIA family hydrolase [Pseudomonas guariconensis]|uniref:HAD-IIA family hydrolase n=1 Tax=Pseudomonas guariconensis TaxID=1288410 RepID=UPI0018A97954|nr:HAD-IIA family hydrolase [Pseudomonas guariconensis]MBF8742106.1 HAD-IIA family hydrolase [Pseudomonas guariconensis]MBF8751102.1 HAD-IIA family hydrolase [Pseudomonas guariconensis]